MPDCNITHRLLVTYIGYIRSLCSFATKLYIINSFDFIVVSLLFYVIIL